MLLVLLVGARSGENFFITAITIFTLLLGVIAGVVPYLTTIYGIVGNSFEYKSGWLYKQHKVIPLERIQSVNIEQNVLHRIFGSARLEIDTAVQNKTSEVSIDAISYEEAQALRLKLLQKVHIPAANAENVSFEAPEAQPILFKITVPELVMHGFAHNRWLYIVAGAFALIEYARDETQALRFIAKFYQSSGPDTVARVVLTLVFLFLAGWLLSVGFSLTKYYGYQIQKHPRGLHTECGLFTKRNVVIPINRISGINISSNWLMRYMNMCSIDVNVIGSSMEKDSAAQSAGSIMLCPWISKNRVESLVQLVYPNADLKPSGEWRSMHHNGIVNNLVRLLIQYGLVCVLMYGFNLLYSLELTKIFSKNSNALWIASNIWWIVLLILFVLRLIAYLFELKNTKVRIKGDKFEHRKGWYTRTWQIVPIARVQTASINTSSLERRLGLASLELILPATAVKVRDITKKDAEEHLKKVLEIRSQHKTRGV